MRYQFGNHLGSAVLELDDQSAIISYEEYFPYGATSYQAVTSQTDLPKRYRFTGKERDTENDLYYHGARYCAPWLGRWITCDPIPRPLGQTPYGYTDGNPVRYTDLTGREPDDDTKPELGTSTVPGPTKSTPNAPDPAQTSFPPIVPKPQPDPMNAWYSSMAQGSGVMTVGSIDVEAGTLVIASKTTGLTLRLPILSGGLSSGVLAIRQQVGPEGLDIGITAAGSYTGQGSSAVTTGSGSAPGTRQSSESALGTVHYGAKGLGDTNWIAAGYLSLGYQQGDQSGQPSTNAGVAQGVLAVGKEWDAPGQNVLTLSGEQANPNAFYLSSVLANPVATYASHGSLSQGPALKDLWSAGGIGSVGVGWGNRWGLLGEASVMYSTGSSIDGSDQAAHSLAWRAGIVLTHNYLESNGSGLQTSSWALGLWGGQEYGTTTGAGSSSWTSTNIFAGAMFGYRKSPETKP